MNQSADLRRGLDGEGVGVRASKGQRRGEGRGEAAVGGRGFHRLMTWGGQVVFLVAVGVFGGCVERTPAPGVTEAALDTCANTNDGAHCSDGNPCTSNDICVAHKCVGTAVANGMTCTDGDPCTRPDTCQLGFCVPGPVLADGMICDDGDFCQAPSTCQAGFCRGGATLSCDDGLACTLDLCEPTSGCVTRPNPACVDGAVVEVAPPDGAPMDDGGNGETGGRDGNADGMALEDGGDARDVMSIDARDVVSPSDGTTPDLVVDGNAPDGDDGRDAGDAAAGGRGPLYTAKGGACSCQTGAEGGLSWIMSSLLVGLLLRRRRERGQR